MSLDPERFHSDMAGFCGCTEVRVGVSLGYRITRLVWVFVVSLVLFLGGVLLGYRLVGLMGSETAGWLLPLVLPTCSVLVIGNAVLAYYPSRCGNCGTPLRKKQVRTRI